MITVQQYREEHEPAVQAFNDRLQAGGAAADLVFYPYAVPRWLAKSDGCDVFNEYFVALEDDTVRGAYALKCQKFLLPDGNVRSIGYYHHVLSEGIVNRSYASVGALLLRDAMMRSSLLYCLGMGGYDRPLPKMLVGLEWKHCAIPFYFRIVRPFRFLREMNALRSSRARRLLMDLGAFTGAGWLGWRAWRLLREKSAPPTHSMSVRTNEPFGDWADCLWHETKGEYGFTAVRESRTLGRLYHPDAAAHLVRVRVTHATGDAGWAVVGERRTDAKYGAMRVGSIVDCWARPGDEPAVVSAAVETLEDRGVDLILTNQSHHRWRRALGRRGFLTAPSTFIFAASPKLAALLEPFETTATHMHFTRADGDGLPRNY